MGGDAAWESCRCGVSVCTSKDAELPGIYSRHASVALAFAAATPPPAVVPALAGAARLVWLDGRRLLYVKKRCAVWPENFFLHVVPVDPDELADERKKHGYDNLDFRDVHPRQLGATRQCVVIRDLPDYAIAAIRTGQVRRQGTKFRQLWRGEYRFPADDRPTELQGER